MWALPPLSRPLASMVGSPSLPGTPCPLRGHRGSQQGPIQTPPAWVGVWEADQSRETGNLFSSGELGREPGGLGGAQPPPSPLPAAQTPPHLCGAGGHQGWTPTPTPAVLVGSPGPRLLGTPSQAGTGSAGREGEGSEGRVPTPVGTRREGPGDAPTWNTTTLPSSACR